MRERCAISAAISRAGASGVQGAAHRRLGDPVDARAAGRLEVGGQRQFGAQLGRRRPGHDDREIGLDEEVVDRLGQRAGQHLLGGRPAARAQRAAVAGQAAGGGDAEQVGLGEDRLGERPLAARPARLVPGQRARAPRPRRAGRRRAAARRARRAPGCAAPGRCRARRPGRAAVITRSRSPRWPTRLGWRVMRQPGQREVGPPRGGVLAAPAVELRRSAGRPARGRASR